MCNSRLYGGLKYIQYKLWNKYISSKFKKLLTLWKSQNLKCQEFAIITFKHELQKGNNHVQKCGGGTPKQNL